MSTLDRNRALGVAAALAVVFAVDLAIPLGTAVGVLYMVPVLMGLRAHGPRLATVTAFVATGCIARRVPVEG